MIIPQATARDIALAFGLKHQGGGYGGACPCCGYPTGFTLTERDGKTLFYCHAGGCRGDEIIAVLKAKGLWGRTDEKRFSQYKAATVAIPATARPGLRNSATVPATICYSEKNVRLANKLWSKSRPAQGTLVEHYLQTRGITCSTPATIRFLPRCWHDPSKQHFPAMIAKVTPWQGNPLVAIHRTYLKPDGSGKIDDPQAKMILGPVKGYSVHLAKPTEVLAIAEGLETALSIYQATGIPTWAALSCGGIQNLILPYLPQAFEVIICADHDATGIGMRMAANAAKRWLSEGRVVRIVQPSQLGTDFNDVLRNNPEGEAT